MEKKTKISIENQAIINTYKYQKAQQETVSDIADMVQSLYQLLDDNTKVDALKVKQFGAVLMDIRDSIKKLDKETKFPDFAKPIVEAVNKLDKTLKNVELNPQIKVDAPQVNVDSPSVNVDLKGVEKLLKNEVPKAFKEAIALIPQTEIPEQEDRWDEVIEALAGIEVAARLKPQMPTTIKVTNPDGTEISAGGGGTSTALAAYVLVQDDENATYEYYGYVKDDGSWCLKRVTISTNYSEFVTGASNYATAWTNRASQTYADYWTTF